MQPEAPQEEESIWTVGAVAGLTVGLLAAVAVIAAVAVVAKQFRASHARPVTPEPPQSPQQPSLEDEQGQPGSYQLPMPPPQQYEAFRQPQIVSADV